MIYLHSVPSNYQLVHKHLFSLCKFLCVASFLHPVLVCSLLLAETEHSSLFTPQAETEHSSLCGQSWVSGKLNPRN